MLENSIKMMFQIIGNSSFIFCIDNQEKIKNKLLVIIGCLVSVGTIDIISKIVPGMSFVKSVRYSHQF